MKTIAQIANEALMDLSPKRPVIREVLISQDGKVDLGEIASAIAAFSPGRANNRHRQGTGCRPKQPV